MAAACASMASVGTTPPHGAWISACRGVSKLHTWKWGLLLMDLRVKVVHRAVEVFIMS